MRTVPAKAGCGSRYAEQTAQLPAMKQMFPWLGELPSQPLQQTLRDLDKAYANFFEGRAGYPTYVFPGGVTGGVPPPRRQRHQQARRISARRAREATRARRCIPQYRWPRPTRCRRRDRPGRDRREPRGAGSSRTWRRQPASSSPRHPPALRANRTSSPLCPSAKPKSSVIRPQILRTLDLPRIASNRVFILISISATAVCFL